jgi:hypothetical protein
VGLTLTALMTAPSWAQDPNYNTDRTSAPLPPTVSFPTAPEWERVPGTDISIIRQDQRPTYDMFSFANDYWVFNKGYWYRASQINGPYVSVESSALPVEFRTVPRATWISYPAGWETRSTVSGSTAMGGSGTSGSMSVNATEWTPPVAFSTAPHWTVIPGTSVYQVRAAERPSYDLFRFGTNYYAYQNGNWYKASRTNGPYSTLTMDQVPTQFRTVREKYWASYPTGWTYQNTSVKTKVKVKHHTSK